jgi:hypothetical protein
MEDIKIWLWEGMKTAIRFSLFVVIPILVDNLLANLSGIEMSTEMRWGLTILLTVADKSIHEWKKDTNTEGSYKGLIGF